MSFYYFQLSDFYDLYPIKSKVDKNGNYVYRCEFPGYSKDEVYIDYDEFDNKISVKTKHDKETKYLFSINKDHDVKNAEAVYKEGLLTITIPPIKNKKISIEIK